MIEPTIKWIAFLKTFHYKIWQLILFLNITYLIVLYYFDSRKIISKFCMKQKPFYSNRFVQLWFLLYMNLLAIVIIIYIYNWIYFVLTHHVLLHNEAIHFDPANYNIKVIPNDPFLINVSTKRKKRNLEINDFILRISDSYVKICLLVQNKVLKSKKTEVVKKTDNPNFSESFTFKLPVSNLDSASINITAMQHQSGYKGRYHIYSILCGRVVSEVELVFHKPLKKEVVSLNPVRGRGTRLQS